MFGSITINLMIGNHSKLKYFRVEFDYGTWIIVFVFHYKNILNTYIIEVWEIS